MKTNKWHIFLISALLSSLFIYSLFFFSSIVQPYPSIGGVTYEIRVVNGFTDNSSVPLVIWCVSRDPADDLGGRALQEGDDFSWNVRTKFWELSKVFTCTMKWDQKRRSFEAFRVSRDSRRCGVLMKCLWLVKEDGFYFSNDDVHWVKDFSWP